MTNKEWLATLSAEDFYKEFKKAEEEGQMWTSTSDYVIKWLDEERDQLAKKELKDHELFCNLSDPNLAEELISHLKEGSVKIFTFNYIYGDHFGIALVCGRSDVKRLIPTDMSPLHVDEIILQMYRESKEEQHGQI